MIMRSSNTILYLIYIFISIPIPISIFIIIVFFNFQLVSIFIEEYFYMDYTLTEDDIMHCRKAIEDLDDDGNGRVGINDLGTVLERMGMHYE